MADSMQLRVVLAMAERVVAPLKKINSASQETARALKEAKDKLKELEKVQSDAKGYQRTNRELRGNSRDLEQTKAKAEQYTQALADQRERHQNIAASLRAAKHGYKQITNAYQDGKITGAEYTRQIELSRITLLSSEQAHGRSKASVDKYKAQVKNAADKVRQLTQAMQGGQERLAGYKERLEAAGVNTARLAVHHRALKGEMAAANTVIDAQKSKMEALSRAEEQRVRLTERHRESMMRLAKWSGAGMVMKMGGQRVGGALMQPVNAFADAESATAQLSAALMGADGSVPAEFAQINALAERLGDKLPGTTADFINMMTMLRRQGISAQTILGGTGEAAAYLGVQLKMPVTAAAEFAAKMQDATQTTERDMMALMDMIQRTFYLGVDSDNMLQGFTKTAAVMPLLGKKGVDAANMLAPMLVMMDQAGMKGEAAGNAIRKVVQLSMDSEKLAKANKLLAGSGVQLQFYGKDGKFAGFDNLFAQLDKLKGISSDVARIAVMKKLFGDDAETHQVLGTLMDKGLAGYRETEQKMRAQADLTRRVNEELNTLKNRAEAAQGSFTNMLKELGASIAPELKTLLDWLGEMAVKVGTWAKEHPTATKAIMLTVAAIGAFLAAAGMLTLAVVTVLGPLTMARFILGKWALGLLASRAAAGVAAGGMGILYRVGLRLGRAFGVIWRALRLVSRINPWGALVVFATAAFASISERWDELKSYFSAGEWSKFWGVMWEVFESTLDKATMGFYGFIKGLLAAGKSALGFGDGADDRTATARKAAAAAVVAAGAAGAMPATADQAAVRLANPAPLTIAGPKASGALGSGTYNITINAAPGQDAQAIAAAVRAELDKRERAGRSRVLSQLSDID